MPDFLPSNLPKDGDYLLVTDELASPADFILHKALAFRLRTQDPVLIVSSCHDGAVEKFQGGRWRSIAAKSGLNTSQNIASNSLVFLDVSPSSDSLKSTFAEIAKHASRSTLVIVDDISSLAWTGLSALEITRFVRAVVAVCRNSSSQLIIRQHLLSPPSSTSLPSSYDPIIDEDGVDDQIYRVLSQLCTSHMEVCRLSSGRSGSVSGQIALHPGPLSKGAQSIQRSSAVQYCLTDFGATFFERGTGAAVL